MICRTSGCRNPIQIQMRRRPRNQFFVQQQQFQQMKFMADGRGDFRLRSAIHSFIFIFA